MLLALIEKTAAVSKSATKAMNAFRLFGCIGSGVWYSTVSLSPLLPMLDQANGYDPRLQV